MRTFGLIGEKLGHSFSKNFFTQYFTASDIDAEYLNFELGNITELTGLFTQDLSGLNVTIPFKESVIAYLDEVSDEAAQIGAVNCISFREGKVIGYNTDAYGFHNSIKPFLTNKHERALIFGTGGASKAVAYVLRSIGVEVFFISRSPNGPRSFGYEDINEQMMNSCKLVVNCTPIGMYPDVNSSLPVLAQAISEEHLFVDLVYNPELTKTMEIFLERGATAINGEAMLKLQAMRSWQIWNS
jgi:shikimate dehydrogenase